MGLVSLGRRSHTAAEVEPPQPPLQSLGVEGGALPTSLPPSTVRSLSASCVSIKGFCVAQKPGVGFPGLHAQCAEE
jgi:hypothetical protein